MNERNEEDHQRQLRDFEEYERISCNAVINLQDRAYALGLARGREEAEEQTVCKWVRVESSNPPVYSRACGKEMYIFSKRIGPFCHMCGRKIFIEAPTVSQAKDK